MSSLLCPLIALTVLLSIQTVAVSGLELSCKFETDTYDKDIAGVFRGTRCDLSRISLLERNKHQDIDFTPTLETTLRKTTKIYISDSTVEFIPVAFKNYFSNLKILALNKVVKLEELQQAFFEAELTSVKFLKIYNDAGRGLLRDIDENAFKNLPNLINLEVSTNRLTSLEPNTFRHARNLEVINFRNNKIRTLPGSIFNGLSNLETVKFQSNQIRDLDANLFKDNRRIREIYLNENKIKVLPNNFLKDLTILEKLNLGSNQIEIIASNTFSNNKQLREISLYANRIKKIGQGTFSNLPNLKDLDLRGNNCVDTCFVTTTNLCHVGVQFSYFSDLTKEC